MTERRDARTRLPPESPGRTRSRLSIDVRNRRKLPLVLAEAHEPLDAHRERRGDGLRPVVEISLEIRVGEAHFFFVGLPKPEAGARRALDDRRRDVQLARHGAHFALDELTDRQQIAAAVAVLREVAD